MEAWSIQTLDTVADMATDKVSVASLTLDTYISTENMLPDRGGIELAPKLPPSGSVNAFLPGDVLFSNIRTYFKKVWLAPWPGGSSADVIVFRPKNRKQTDSRFLYYVLSSDAFIQATVTASKGTKMPRGDKEAMKRYEIPLPPLPIQHRIAGILSAYDELIENSQRRIKILEEMSRALYREWFVHFRFPGHESIPLVPSAIGDIPQGWEVKNVKNILVRRAAGTVYREADVKQEGAIPVLDQSTNELLGFHDNEADHSASPESPLAMFGDHTCKMQLLIAPFSVGPNVVPFAAGAGLPTAYVFYAVNNLVQTQEYKRHWIPLNAKEVVVADTLNAQRFACVIQPMLVEQSTLRTVIRNLRRTRDLLLPRLLSGQIDVEALNHV